MREAEAVTSTVLYLRGFSWNGQGVGATLIHKTPTGHTYMVAVIEKKHLDHFFIAHLYRPNQTSPKCASIRTVLLSDAVRVAEQHALSAVWEKIPE